MFKSQKRLIALSIPFPYPYVWCGLQAFIHTLHKLEMCQYQKYGGSVQKTNLTFPISLKES